MIAASWALIPRRLPRPPPQRTCRAAEPGNFSVPRNPVVVSLAAEDTTMKKLLMLAALAAAADRKSTRLNSSHGYISYAVFCLKKKKKIQQSGLKFIALLCRHRDGLHVVNTT